MNLLDEYFKRDLTEPEEQELAEQLARSPLDTGRMAQGMAELYRQTGLPEPVWNHPPPVLKVSPWHWMAAFFPLVLFLSAMGFGIYLWWTGSHGPASSGAESTPSLSSAGPVDLKKRIPTGSGLAVSNGSGQASRPTGDRTSSGPGGPVSSAPILPATPTIAVPPSLSSSDPFPGRQYEELSVIVEPSETRLVTIRVLDSQNHSVRRLFAGILPPVKRTFIWDGKLEKGDPAPVGTYFIEVKTGKNATRREVHVQ